MKLRHWQCLRQVSNLDVSPMHLTGLSTQPVRSSSGNQASQCKFGKLPSRCQDSHNLPLRQHA